MQNPGGGSIHVLREAPCQSESSVEVFSGKLLNTQLASSEHEDISLRSVHDVIHSPVCFYSEHPGER